MKMLFIDKYNNYKLFNLTYGNLRNYYTLSFGTQILDKSDLNSYKEPGNYYCSGSLAAQQLLNSPTREAFVMKVELGTGINYPTQTITSFGNGKKYFRVYIPENNEWRDWVEYVTNTDLTARFNPIEINGTKGDTFKNVLKNKCNNSVNFIVFNGSTENPISDNPFTSKNGYCIAFNSDRLNAYNYFILLGITKDIIETKIFDARS